LSVISVFLRRVFPAYQVTGRDHRKCGRPHSSSVSCPSCRRCRYCCRQLGEYLGHRWRLGWRLGQWGRCGAQASSNPPPTWIPSNGCDFPPSSSRGPAG
jgi:hypothetical protein